MEILFIDKTKDYELIDSGDGEKLERYGQFVLSRPDLQAIWPKTLSEAEWKLADAVFTRTGTFGKWKTSLKMSKNWKIGLDGLIFQLQLLPSKHIGVFPEQSIQWKWLTQIISKCKTNDTNKKIQVLNLFGYTGGASLACAKLGAEVCHVDSSDFAVDLAHTNMKLSGLEKSKIRFIVDDVRKFVEREIKRGNKYDIIIMDPPVYGKGAKGEVWKIEKDLVILIERVKRILSENPLAIIINGYSSGYSNITYRQVLEKITSDLGGGIVSGELFIKESSSGKLLSCGIFARWEN